MSCTSGLLVMVTLAGCASFEDPAIVRDLRVIAMVAQPPEQVLDVDLATMPKLPDLVDQLASSFVCAIVADPGRARSLRWSMTACLEDNARCDPARPSMPLGAGVLFDPETSAGELSVCVEVPPEPGLIAILADGLEQDPLRGVAGIDYAVELRVGGVDADPALDQYATKRLRVSARFPATKTPNQNPFIGELILDSAGLVSSGSLRHCAASFGEPVIMGAGQALTLFPDAPEQVREMYFLPTIDGTFQMFTETLSYQWLATAGSFEDETTGGPRDLLGNEALAGNEWFAPGPDKLDGPLDVQLWVIQRDERQGVTVYPTCVRVIP